MLNERDSFALYEQLRDNANISYYFDIVKGTGATFGVDGNQFFYIVGDLPEPDCIVGFGDTPLAALQNFSNEFLTMRIKTPPAKSV